MYFFPTDKHNPTMLLFQGSHFSSGDRCDPVPVGGNSGEDCRRSGMAVTAAPAHDTYQLVLPVPDTLQRSSGISLQPAKREVLPAAWFHGWHQPQLQRVTKRSGSHSLLSECFKHRNTKWWFGVKWKHLCIFSITQSRYFELPNSATKSNHKKWSFL